MAKKKPLPPQAAESEGLSRAEEFYIDNNQNKTDIELSNDLLKPVNLIRKHIHKTQSCSRVSKLLVREKGCVIMTEGASMAADDSRKKYVSESAIKEAASKGDYEEASRLQKIHNQQHQKDSDDARKRNESYIHYMNKD